MIKERKSCEERIEEMLKLTIKDMKEVIESKDPVEEINNKALALTKTELYKLELSAGGPSDYIEFEFNPENKELERITYHFLDWFDGAKRDIEYNTDEWKILEGTVDSQYGVGDPEWNGTEWRGFDVGKHIKSTNGWDLNGNGDDSFGFSVLPGGHTTDGSFYNLGTHEQFWTSSSTWHFNLMSESDKVGRYHYVSSLDGFAVRCMKD